MKIKHNGDTRTPHNNPNPIGYVFGYFIFIPLKIETDRGIPKIYRFEFGFGEDKTHHRLQMQCSQASWILRDHLGQFVMVQ
jgi:hypothetical protein